MKFKIGISLIVLIITIIVIIILAGVVILSITKNNPIGSANEAVFKSDIDNFESELSIYNANNYSKLLGQYEEYKLQADNTKVEYTGVGQIDVKGKTIKDIITGLGSNKYENQFEIINGKLAYKGTDKIKQQWSLDKGILVDDDKTNVTISTSNILPIKSTGTIEYTINIYSNVGIKDIGDITNSIKVINKDSKEVTATLILGEIKNLTNEKQISVTIQGTGLADGEYKVKLLAGTVENNANLKNVDTISINSFAVDNTAPTDPSIVSSPITWTNQDVTATITYPSDSVKNEYSYDGINWQSYTANLTVLNNCTIYAKATDKVGNVSGESTLSITNIDKIAPQVVTQNSSANSTVLTLKIVAKDSESGINTSSYQFSRDNGNSWTSEMFNDTYTFTGIANGRTFNCMVRAKDKAGNISTSDAISILVTPYPMSNASVNEGRSTGTPILENSTINGAVPGYSNPVIPAGFVAVDTDSAKWSDLSSGSWNNGLVIQDTAENQFVWVPVDGTNVAYAKWCTTNIAYNDSNISDDTLPSDFDANKITSTYKGFYIARYASSNNMDKAASKKAIAWRNNINYTNSKLKSESMDTDYGYDTTKVGTNLITGTQWDTTMRWIQNTGISVTDCTSWGNYYNATFKYEYPTAGTKAINTSTLLYTGAAIRNRVKNIYDLAGNIAQWTNEKYSSNGFVIRGGGYFDAGSSYPAAFRNYNNASFTYDDLGFRVSLYIK